ncbi:hypothetical protein BRD15_10370 [Halobacteriales archaeon SW_6_65_15]|nr:MAG: hypothetical protein BRD15_10370 [Halobacteriales archaeon SW_6_65_15]
MHYNSISFNIEKENEATENNAADIDRRSYLKMIGTGAGFSAGGVGLSSLGTQSVRATQESPCNTVDDFEDSDLSEYEFDRGSSGASLVTSPTYSGAYALEISGTNTEMISMEGLEHYPAAGDVFSTWVRGTNNADRINITYGVQNHLNRYFARINPEQGHIALYRYEDGSSTLLADKGVALSQDTWYEVHIDWQTDGTHVFTLFDESGSQIDQISAIDSTWTAGGIGYDAYLGDGGTVYFDHTQIHSGREIVSANEVIDSFEDSDLSEYTFDQGSASVVSSPTYGGSSVLEFDNVKTEMISTSGLNHYPDAGDVFSCWVRGTGGADDVNFTYGVQDHENRYFVRVDFANNDLFLFRYEGGDFYQLAEDATASFSEDTWYNIEVDWRKTGTHIVTVYGCDGKQVTQITGTDSTWTSGGIGYDAYLADGGTAYFDYVAIHSSVLDDFEDGDLSEYSGDTGSFTVQNSTVLEGNQTLKGTSAGSAIALNNVETPRGYVYSCSIKIESGSGAKPALVVGAQDPATPLESCYYLSADADNNNLSLYRRDNGSSVLLEQSDATIEKGVEYQLSIELVAGAVFGEIQDSSGNPIKAVGEYDSTYSTGHLGLYLGGGSAGYFDSLTKKPNISGFADSFEDGTLSEYSGDTSSYTVQSSTVLKGDHTLKCEKSYTGIAHNSVETTRGRAYRSQVMAGGNSESRPGLLACVQNLSSPIDDCYWAQANPEYGKLKIMRRDSGTTTVLDEVGATIEKGKEYQLELELREDSVKATLYTENGVLLEETSAVPDTTFDRGYLGFYTGGSSAPAYYDNVIEYSPRTVIGTEVSATSDETQRALDATMTQEVLSDLNNPSTDPSNAVRVNAYRDDEVFEGYGIRIPMEYGDLVVSYIDGEINEANADLDRDSMPSSLRDDLSDSFGWPSSENGGLVNNTDLSGPHFTRSATNAERDDIKSLIADYDGRTDEPGPMQVMNRDGGYYHSPYYNKRYHSNDTRDEVSYEDEWLHSHDTCEEKANDCTKETVFTAGSAVATGAGCAVSLGFGCAVGTVVTQASAASAGKTCGEYVNDCGGPL